MPGRRSAGPAAAAAAARGASWPPGPGGPRQPPGAGTCASLQEAWTSRSVGLGAMEMGSSNFDVGFACLRQGRI